MFKTYRCILFCSFLWSSIFIQNTFSQYKWEATGIWQARGYGWVMELNAETLKIYDITKMSCTASQEYPTTMLSKDLTVVDNVLTLSRGVNRYTFDRLSVLPDLCTKRLSKKERKDPIFNFEVLWNSFNDQYAYFEERGVDWQKSYEKYRKQISDKTSDAELLVICDQMLEDLNDGHVDIEASEKLMKKAALIGKWDTRPDPDISGARRAIVTKYLKDFKTHNLSRTIWGKINDRVGYVQINSMGAQGEYGITPDMDSGKANKLYRTAIAKSEDPMIDEINGMNATMKKVLIDLKGTEDLILDLRFNGGGEDMVGLAVLSYFIDSTRTIFSKKERIGKGFGPQKYTVLKPAGIKYKGKLHILQSHWSASATEILLLASLSLENVRRIGSPSEGIFSDILDKKLPNGWEYGLSNQVYQDNEGISYETKGIPVHIDLDYPRDTYEFVAKLKKEVKTGGDPAIEAVLMEKRK